MSIPPPRRSSSRLRRPPPRSRPSCGEIGKAHRKGDLPGRKTLDAKWYIGSELVAYGRKPGDYDQAAFQGIHAEYVLIVIDAADGDDAPRTPGSGLSRGGPP
jgi:hypothetical protein